MEKEIEDINATLTPSLLNRRHAQHSNQSWACAHGCLCSLLRKGQVLTGIRHKGKRRWCLSVPSGYLSTRMPFCSERHDHPSSLSPGKLAADIEGFFCAESKMAFQKSISTCPYVFKHVKSLGCTQIELLGILSLPFAAKLSTIKKK